MHVKHLGQCQIHSNHLLLGALKQRERRGKEERGQERRGEEKKKKKRGEERRGERREKQEFKVFERRNLPPYSVLPRGNLTGFLSSVSHGPRTHILCSGDGPPACPA